MNIFVSSLNFKVKREDLTILFEPYGEVTSSRIILDKQTRRSKGYGFVEMPNDMGAYVAIVELDDCVFQGSVIDVKKSKTEQVTYTI
jgi:RNA recognition motif-containing protein